MAKEWKVWDVKTRLKTEGGKRKVKETYYPVMVIMQSPLTRMGSRYIVRFHCNMFIRTKDDKDYQQALIPENGPLEC